MHRRGIRSAAVLAAVGFAALACSSSARTEGTAAVVQDDPSFDCAALMPSEPGAPIVVTTKPLPDYIYGQPGQSDGAGTVLLIQSGHLDSTELFFYSADGSLKRSLFELNLAPLAQRVGFVGLQNATLGPVETPTFRLFRLSAESEPVYEPPQDGQALQASNPGGGLMLLSLASHELQAWDGSLQLRWSTPLSIPRNEEGSTALAMGVDLDGNTLVLYDDSQKSGPDAIAGLWSDSSGRVAVRFGASTAPPGEHHFALSPAIGGGLFLRDFHEQLTWIAEFPSLRPTRLPAPAWLTSRPGTDLQLIKGGRGYALSKRARAHGDGSNGSCDLEVLTKDGTSCGTAGFEPGGPGCQSIRIGQDGTVIIQPIVTDTDCRFDSDGYCRWTWKWWPKLLE
jgi:hypothetical protein